MKPPAWMLWLWGFAHGFVTAVLVVVVSMTCAGCGIQNIGGGLGLDLPGFGLVYQCSAPELMGDTLELCYDRSAAELEASLAENGIDEAECIPTTRHAGPCIYGCEEHTGCNAIEALDGCYCPPE